MAVSVDPNDFVPMEVPIEFIAENVSRSDDGMFTLTGTVKIELGSEWRKGRCAITISRNEAGTWVIDRMNIVPDPVA